MMFVGSIIIASFGAAGILSALAASNGEYGRIYLIGTSVSYSCYFTVYTLIMHDIVSYP